MIRRLSLALALMLVVAGCSSASITQAPPPTNAATQAPSADVSPSSDAGSSVAPTDAATPKATPTPAPTPTPKATPTPAPTATPTPTPTPAATPTSRAQACSGTAEHKQFFADAAAQLSFNVYCAVLPSGWWFKAGSYTVPSGGYLEVTYGSSNATITVREGRDCPPSKACIAYGGLIGPANLGPMAGQLYLNTSTYSLVVAGTKPYVMYSSGTITQAKFLALAATFVKVPKS